MSYSEIDHFESMIEGCESINAGGPLTPNGHYAFGVLKLHSNDLGSYAGQEGFLDSVKKGAKATGEFVKKLYEAIKKFFASMLTSNTGKVNKIKAVNEDARAKVWGRLKSGAPSIAAAYITQANSAKTASLAERVKSPIDKSKVIAAAEKVKEEAGKSEPTIALAESINALLNAAAFYSKSMQTAINKANAPSGDKVDPDYNGLVMEYKKFAEINNRMFALVNEAWSLIPDGKSDEKKDDKKEDKKDDDK